LQFTAKCQSYTVTAAQLTISLPFCCLVYTLCSLKRVYNKVTLLGRFVFLLFYVYVAR